MREPLRPGGRGQQFHKVQAIVDKKEQYVKTSIVAEQTEDGQLSQPQLQPGGPHEEPGPGGWPERAPPQRGGVGATATPGIFGPALGRPRSPGAVPTRRGTTTATTTAAATALSTASTS